nr:polysaccharide biosynthesis protein [Cohnella cholangitidis]
MQKYIRLVVLLISDALLVAASVYLSYLLRFDFTIKPEFIGTLPYVMSLYIVLIVVGLYSFKIYKRIWQYASVGDLIAILKGTAVGSIAFYSLHYFLHDYVYTNLVVPRSIYLLTTMISFLFISGSRFFWRLFRDSYIKIQPHHRRALIVGAGEAGIVVVRELKHSHRSEIYPVAFIDDDTQKQKYEVLGIPVVGTREDIQEVVRQYEIDDIIVAIPTASRADISDIINRSKSTGCQIKIVPRMNDLINGKISINMIRDVSVEDLLGREPVKVDLDEIAGYLKDQIVLITGAGGSIGSEISRQVAAMDPRKLIVLDHGENSIYDIELELRATYPRISMDAIIADIKDRVRIEQVFRQYRPQVVFHAAAHKHVPLMESNPLEAVKNNVFGTKNVAECAHEFGTGKFVLISTDKAVNPTNVMGLRSVLQRC